jgi:hypothetical protein
MEQLAISGDKPYQRKAREAFPLLVRQARGEEPITYSALAAELDMPNPRNLNYVLGAIGNTIEQLNGRFREKIPPIQFLVVQKISRAPGPGVSFYVPDVPDFRGLSLRQRRHLAAEKRREIYAFNAWEEILSLLGLQAPPPQLTESSFQALASLASSSYGSEESAAHRLLKQFVAGSPTILDLGQVVLKTSQEFLLPSGDAIDVFVETAELWVAVEIKPHHAPLHDILRGLFQCIKYKALLRALAAVQSANKETASVLVLGSALPKEIQSIKNVLGLRVIENAEAMRIRSTAANPAPAADGRRRR